MKSKNSFFSVRFRPLQTSFVNRFNRCIKKIRTKRTIRFRVGHRYVLAVVTPPSFLTRQGEFCRKIEHCCCNCCFWQRRLISSLFFFRCFFKAPRTTCVLSRLETDCTARAAAAAVMCGLEPSFWVPGIWYEA